MSHKGQKMMKKTLMTCVMFASIMILSGCDDTKTASSNPLQQTGADALTILAGSELKDMEPILRQASEKTGVKLNIEYTGTIDGVDRIKSGANYDMAWFSQSKYFYDTDENAKKIKQSEKVMFSPVVVGMREKSYLSSGLATQKHISWANLYDVVSKKGYKYAMTDPSASNTGYSALMGVAYSTANKSEALTEKDVDKNKMQAFFKGHVVNSGSSGWLVQAFQNSQADFMVNYENVLVQYNQDRPNDQLHIIYPYEGIVTADYPLLLLNMNKAEDYKKLVAYLKTPEIQEQIAKQTHRRVMDKTVMDKQLGFSKELLIEMPFNPDVALSDKLLVSYFQEYKKPAAIVFVMDVSGSMAQSERMKDGVKTRIEMLKSAMGAIANSGVGKAQYTNLRSREKVWLMPFASNIKDIQAYELTTDIQKNQQIKQNIKQYVDTLQPQDGTYLFSTIEQAVDLLNAERQKNPDYQYSVVVLTDGESNEGINAQTFEAHMAAKNLQGQIRVFPIFFGDADKRELTLVANASGGKLFDGKNKNLADVFKEIRTYQ